MEDGSLFLLGFHSNKNDKYEELSVVEDKQWFELKVICLIEVYTLSMIIKASGLNASLRR